MEGSPNWYGTGFENRHGFAALGVRISHPPLRIREPSPGSEGRNAAVAQAEQSVRLSRGRSRVQIPPVALDRGRGPAGGANPARRWGRLLVNGSAARRSSGGLKHRRCRFDSCLTHLLVAPPNRSAGLENRMSPARIPPGGLHARSSTGRATGF